MREDKPMIEHLKEARDKRQKELDVINEAIKLVEADRNWEIILKAQSLI